MLIVSSDQTERRTVVQNYLYCLIHTCSKMQSNINIFKDCKKIAYINRANCAVSSMHNEDKMSIKDAWKVFNLSVKLKA